MKHQTASLMIVLPMRCCPKVLFTAIKENICSEYQRDSKVEKLFMSQDIRHINARRLTKK